MLPDVGAGPQPRRGGGLSGERQKHLERLLQGWRWMEMGGVLLASPSWDTPSCQPSRSSLGGWECSRSVLVF